MNTGIRLANAIIAQARNSGADTYVLDGDDTIFAHIINSDEFRRFFFGGSTVSKSKDQAKQGSYANPVNKVDTSIEAFDDGKKLIGEGGIVENPISPEDLEEILVPLFETLQNAGIKIQISTMNRSEIIEILFKANGLMGYVSAIGAIDGIYSVENNRLNKVSDISTKGKPEKLDSLREMQSVFKPKGIMMSDDAWEIGARASMPKDISDLGITQVKLCAGDIELEDRGKAQNKKIGLMVQNPDEFTLDVNEEAEYIYGSDANKDAAIDESLGDAGPGIKGIQYNLDGSGGRLEISSISTPAGKGPLLSSKNPALEFALKKQENDLGLTTPVQQRQPVRVQPENQYENVTPTIQPTESLYSNVGDAADKLRRNIQAQLDGETDLYVNSAQAVADAVTAANTRKWKPQPDVRASHGYEQRVITNEERQVMADDSLSALEKLEKICPEMARRVKNAVAEGKKHVFFDLDDSLIAHTLKEIFREYIFDKGDGEMPGRQLSSDFEKSYAHLSSQNFDPNHPSLKDDPEGRRIALERRKFITSLIEDPILVKLTIDAYRESDIHVHAATLNTTELTKVLIKDAGLNFSTVSAIDGQLLDIELDENRNITAQKTDTKCYIKGQPPYKVAAIEAVLDHYDDLERDGNGRSKLDKIEMYDDDFHNGQKSGTLQYLEERGATCLMKSEKGGVRFSRNHADLNAELKKANKDSEKRLEEIKQQQISALGEAIRTFIKTEGKSYEEMSSSMKTRYNRHLIEMKKALSAGEANSIDNRDDLQSQFIEAIDLLSSKFQEEDAQKIADAASPYNKRFLGGRSSTERNIKVDVANVFRGIKQRLQGEKVKEFRSARTGSAKRARAEAASAIINPGSEKGNQFDTQSIGSDRSTMSMVSNPLRAENQKEAEKIIESEYDEIGNALGTDFVEEDPYEVMTNGPDFQEEDQMQGQETEGDYAEMNPLKLTSGTTGPQDISADSEYDSTVDISADSEYDSVVGANDKDNEIVYDAAGGNEDEQIQPVLANQPLYATVNKSLVPMQNRLKELEKTALERKNDIGKGLHMDEDGIITYGNETYSGSNVKQETDPQKILKMRFAEYQEADKASLAVVKQKIEIEEIKLPNKDRDNDDPLAAEEIRIENRIKLRSRVLNLAESVQTLAAENYEATLLKGWEVQGVDEYINDKIENFNDAQTALEEAAEGLYNANDKDSKEREYAEASVATFSAPNEEQKQAGEAAAKQIWYQIQGQRAEIEATQERETDSQAQERDAFTPKITNVTLENNNQLPVRLFENNNKFYIGYERRSGTKIKEVQEYEGIGNGKVTEFQSSNISIDGTTYNVSEINNQVEGYQEIFSAYQAAALTSMTPPQEQAGGRKQVTAYPEDPDAPPLPQKKGSIGARQDDGQEHGNPRLPQKMGSKTGAPDSSTQALEVRLAGPVTSRAGQIKAGQELTKAGHRQNQTGTGRGQSC